MPVLIHYFQRSYLGLGLASRSSFPRIWSACTYYCIYKSACVRLQWQKDVCTAILYEYFEIRGLAHMYYSKLRNSWKFKSNWPWNHFMTCLYIYAIVYTGIKQVLLEFDCFSEIRIYQLQEYLLLGYAHTKRLCWKRRHFFSSTKEDVSCYYISYGILYTFKSTKQ